MRVAVAVDRLAVDELHGEVRQPRVGDPAVDQPRDARMLEPREDAPLLDEPPQHARRAVLDQLDRDALLELSVRALAEEHASHPAAPDLAHDAERADLVGDRPADRGRRFEQRRGELCSRRLEQAVRAMIRAHQLEHLGAQLRVVAALAVDERRLLAGGMSTAASKMLSTRRNRSVGDALTCPTRPRSPGGARLFAFAQSRFAVRSPMPSASAVSSSVIPPKKRHSTTWACRASISLSLPSASSMAMSNSARSSVPSST